MRRRKGLHNGVGRGNAISFIFQIVKSDFDLKNSANARNGNACEKEEEVEEEEQGEMDDKEEEEE